MDDSQGLFRAPRKRLPAQAQPDLPPVAALGAGDAQPLARPLPANGQGLVSRSAIRDTISAQPNAPGELAAARARSLRHSISAETPARAPAGLVQQLARRNSGNLTPPGGGQALEAPARAPAWLAQQLGRGKSGELPAHIGGQALEAPARAPAGHAQQLARRDPDLALPGGGQALEAAARAPAALAQQLARRTTGNETPPGGGQAPEREARPTPRQVARRKSGYWERPARPAEAPADGGAQPLARDGPDGQVGALPDIATPGCSAVAARQIEGKRLSTCAAGRQSARQARERRPDALQPGARQAPPSGQGLEREGRPPPRQPARRMSGHWPGTAAARPSTDGEAAGGARRGPAAARPGEGAGEDGEPAQTSARDGPGGQVGRRTPHGMSGVLAAPVCEQCPSRKSCGGRGGVGLAG